MFGFLMIAFVNFVILYREHFTNEHWYVWFVLIAGYFVCRRSWLVTMCDIWPVVGISSIINATCGTGSYSPSWAFGSNSSFMGSCCSNFSFLMWTIVCLLFPLSLWPLSCGMLTSDFPKNYWSKIKHVNIINKWLKD